MDEKALLFAKLTTERAGLWWELIGLSEETLITQPIFADWTAKDVLAHVAAWDEIHCERLRLARDGRPADIPYLPGDATNERLRADRQDWSLAQAVAAGLAARAGFLTLVEPLSWEQMSVTYTLSWGDQRSIFDWCQRRMWHDASHAADIRKWREATGIRGRVGSKVVLEAALEAGRVELLAWAGLVPETERTTRLVCGEWTLKDVLGHVTDWEAFCVDAFADMAAGRVAGLSYTGDEEGWNRAHAAGRRDQPWQAVWDDFSRTRQALMATLAGMDDAVLNRPVKSRWSADDRPYGWFRVCLAHDREHAEGLRAVLG